MRSWPSSGRRSRVEWSSRSRHTFDAGDKLVLMPREMPPFLPPDAEGLFQVVEIRDGTIVAIRDFIHRDDAMAAAGL